MILVPIGSIDAAAIRITTMGPKTEAVFVFILRDSKLQELIRNLIQPYQSVNN